MNSLALLLHNREEYEKALRLWEECLKLRKEVFGETHPDTLISMSNLARLYNDLLPRLYKCLAAV